MGRYYDVEVVHTEMLTPHVKRVDVRRVDGEAFTFKPGQFLMMWFEHEGKRVNRSYSAAGPIEPGEPTEVLELCIKLVEGGIGSAMIRAWSPGATFTASGPHGRFVLRDDELDAVLVGTGTGIAPYRSMRPQIIDRVERGQEVHLVFGARTEDEFLYDDEWRELADRYESFSYWPCADAAIDPDGWAEAGNPVGQVQVALDVIEHGIDDTIFYLCGNPNMVEDIKELLADRGVERRYVRTEAYVSPTV